MVFDYRKNLTAAAHDPSPSPSAARSAQDQEPNQPISDFSMVDIMERPLSKLTMIELKR